MTQIGSIINLSNSFCTKIKKKLNEPLYTIGGETISSRVLKHWHDKGILEDNRLKNKGWRKFSFSEVIWISIVNKLRRFGMDLKSIKKVKQYFENKTGDKISNVSRLVLEMGLEPIRPLLIIGF